MPDDLACIACMPARGRSTARPAETKHAAGFFLPVISGDSRERIRVTMAHANSEKPVASAP
jgi:hypothetical protein